MRGISSLAAALVLLAACAPDVPAASPSPSPSPSPSSSAPPARPVVGGCLSTTGRVQYGGKGDPIASPIDCAEPHQLEVVKTAAFPAGAAVPSWGSADLRAAYADCAAAASAYVGIDFHLGWLFVHVGRPDSTAWAAGDHAYVCGVAETESTNWLAVVLPRSGSLKGARATGSGLVFSRCAQVSGDQPDADGFYQTITGEYRVDCATAHDAELAGVIELPDGPFPEWQAQADYAEPRCIKAIAARLGLSESAFLRRGDIARYTTTLDNEHQWSAGDRVLRCYAVVPSDHLFTGTLEGLGAKPLP
ncbi:septum formation family protein [Dactylosporangium sp. CS-047395]|uniref:septum formation family protein n=1 Tax=Dactylosporangium sp. CS-047395 TaxID=3239936 RepID=UPI003D8A1411